MADVKIDEFLVFSDHHSHPFSYGAEEVLHDGKHVNSRVFHSYDVLRQIKDYAAKNNIKKTVFCGDMFHVPQNLSVAALNLTFSAIKDLAAVSQVFLMPGNHDYADREGKLHSLSVFSSIKNVKVMDWESSLSVSTAGSLGDSVTYAFVPYHLDKSRLVSTIQAHAKAVSGPTILFGHFGIQGATIGSDYVLVSDHDMSASDIPWQAFTGCLFGHYHKHQQLFKNGWYVGATHAHTWGDANERRGFLHVCAYLDYITVKFVETKAPRFLLMDSPAPADALDFVRIKSTDTTLSPEAAEQIKKAVGSAVCEIVHVEKSYQLEDMELSEDNLSPNKMLESWVQANKDQLKEQVPSKSLTEVLEFGRRLLGGSQ